MSVAKQKIDEREYSHKGAYDFVGVDDALRMLNYEECEVEEIARLLHIPPIAYRTFVYMLISKCDEAFRNEAIEVKAYLDRMEAFINLGIKVENMLCKIGPDLAGTKIEQPDEIDMTITVAEKKA